jgi:hypothetical protein
MGGRPIIHSGSTQISDFFPPFKNKQCEDYDYTVGDKVTLIWKDLCKTASWYGSEPWTITPVHTNETIRVESSIKSEKINI